jgi:hypothetical protein
MGEETLMGWSSAGAAVGMMETDSYLINALAHLIRESTLNATGVIARDSKVIGVSDSKIRDRIGGHVSDRDGRTIDS